MSERDFIDSIVGGILNPKGKQTIEDPEFPSVKVVTVGKVAQVIIAYDWKKYEKLGKNPLEYWTKGIELVRKIRSLLPEGMHMRASIEFVSTPPPYITLGDLADELSKSYILQN